MKYEANKNPKGKLYAKFYNSMRTLKSSGLISSSSSRIKISERFNNRKHNVHFGKKIFLCYNIIYVVFLIVVLMYGL